MEARNAQVGIYAWDSGSRVVQEHTLHTLSWANDVIFCVLRPMPFCGHLLFYMCSTLLTILLTVGQKPLLERKAPGSD